MRTPNPHARRGHSLVEMIVAIFVFSTVLTLSIALINALFRLEADVQRHTDTRASTAQLARAFRRDVRAATAQVEPAPEGTIFALRLGPEHLVTYRLENGTPTRRETTADGLKQIERFLLPARTMTIEPLDRDGVLVQRLRIDRRPPERTKGLPKLIQIDAVMAADHRFSATKPNESDNP